MRTRELHFRGQRRGPRADARHRAAEKTHKLLEEPVGARGIARVATLHFCHHAKQQCGVDVAAQGLQFGLAEQRLSLAARDLGLAEQVASVL